MSAKALPWAIIADTESMFSVRTTSDVFSGIAFKTSVVVFVFLSQDGSNPAINIASVTTSPAYILFLISDD